MVYTLKWVYLEVAGKFFFPMKFCLRLAIVWRHVIGKQSGLVKNVEHEFCGLFHKVHQVFLLFFFLFSRKTATLFVL